MMSNWSDDLRSDPLIWVQIPVLPSSIGGKKMVKVDVYTVFSGLIIAVGIISYVWWSTTYNAWTDIGIYSFSVIFILLGTFGFLLSFTKKEE